MVRRIGDPISSSHLKKTSNMGSLPTSQSPRTLKQGLPSRKKPDIPPPVSKDLVMLGAKPSEFRAALKGARLQLKKDKQRQQEIRQHETAAAVRMKRIRDEINAIKAKESELDVDQNKGSFDPRKLSTRKPLHPTRYYGPSSPRPKTAAPLEVTSRGTKNLAMEELLAERRAKIEKAEKEEREREDLRAKTHTEMLTIRGSFSKEEPQEKKRASAHLSISTQAAAVSSAPRRAELAHTKTGKFERTSSVRGLSKGLGRRGVLRTSSNLIPEMRRRANQRDLLFIDTDNAPDTTEGEDFSFEKLTKKAQATEKAGIERRKSLEIAIKPIGQNQNQKQVGAGFKEVEAKKLPITKNTAMKNDKQTSSEDGQRDSTSVFSGKAMGASEVAKSKTKVQGQKGELDQAKEDFDKGYFLCWNCGDSFNAIVEYRKALYTRESLLGKYHEETGRVYFWIGKSLAKLNEYDEALMAFSRAARIFQRVLKKGNKYNIWALTSLETVIRQMDDPDVDFETYKYNLESSITLEQEGDQLRKKGAMAEAISKYRESIEHLDAYHPDVADLYCKIAIIMRQQGEFDRALEEYRYASEIYELSLGAEHPETVNTLNQLITKKALNQKSNALMEKLKLKPPS